MKRIRQSLSAKLFLSITGLLVLISLVIYFTLWFTMPQQLKTQLHEEFTSDYHKLIEQLEQMPPQEAKGLIAQFSIAHSAWVQLMTTQGKEEIFSSDASEEYTPTIFDPSVYYGLSIATDYEYDGSSYTLFASITGSTVSTLYSSFGRIFPYILVLIVALALLTAFFYAHTVAKPIVAMSRTAQRMAELDLSWRSNTKRTDEIGRLSDNLNTMAQRLDGALRELQQANTQLQRDIELERKREQQRTDLFTAISHELKTPITVAKYDLEGMIQNVGRYKDREKYLRHAYEVMDHMEALVQEITEVSQLSAGHLGLHCEPVDLGALVTSCCAGYGELARHQGMTLDTQIQPGVVVSADPSQMRKVVSNLISNAINHSPGGATITVTLQPGELRVVNSGVTIPPEDLDQLFLPFYRVDKSRSRHTGGSGLGLYVTASILREHGFDFRLENGDNAVIFTITL